MLPRSIKCISRGAAFLASEGDLNKARHASALTQWKKGFQNDFQFHDIGFSLEKWQTAPTRDRTQYDKAWTSALTSY